MRSLALAGVAWCRRLAADALACSSGHQWQAGRRAVGCVELRGNVTSNLTTSHSLLQCTACSAPPLHGITQLQCMVCSVGGPCALNCCISPDTCHTARMVRQQAASCSRCTLSHRCLSVCLQMAGEKGQKCHALYREDMLPSAKLLLRGPIPPCRPPLLLPPLAGPGLFPLGLKRPLLPLCLLCLLLCLLRLLLLLRLLPAPHAVPSKPAALPLPPGRNAHPPQPAQPASRAQLPLLRLPRLQLYPPGPLPAALLAEQVLLL